MRRILAATTVLVPLMACTLTPQQQTKVDSALATPAGQLFCAVQTGGGGAVTVALINASLSSVAPDAAPVSILATNMGKAFVDAACARAGGIAVSPPADPAAVPKVAVVPPPVV